MTNGGFILRCIGVPILLVLSVLHLYNAAVGGNELFQNYDFVKSIITGTGLLGASIGWSFEFIQRIKEDFGKNTTAKDPSES